MTAQPGPALPLSGVTVAVLGGAAAYAGRLLAGLGATAILVEPPGGCRERRSPPFAPGPLGPDSSLTFRFSAAGLRSVGIDTTTLDGAQVLRELLGVADVCLDALGWEAANAWTDGARACLADAALPVCTLGPDGQLADIGADDLLVQAASGLMYISGFADSGPIPAPAEFARTQTCLFGATAALAALANSGGEGPAAFAVGAQAAVSMTTLQTSNPGFYTWQGAIPVRGGLANFGGAPYRCRDGWVTFTVPGERWPAFVAWLADEGFDTSPFPARLDSGLLSVAREAMAAARTMIVELAARSPVQTFYHEAQRRGLLSMPVNSVADILRDEHLAAREFFVRTDDGGVELAGPFRSEIWRHPGPAPAYGEATEAFLVERLGYSRTEVESLHAMGAVSCGH